jgi:translation initiation factor IF-3
MFRGREVTHPERGTAILDRLAEELAELGVVEQRPMQEGRNMTMMMAPSKAVLAGRLDGSETPDGETASAAPAEQGAIEPAGEQPVPEPAADETAPAAAAEPAEQLANGVSEVPAAAQKPAGTDDPAPSGAESGAAA